MRRRRAGERRRHTHTAALEIARNEETHARTPGGGRAALELARNVETAVTAEKCNGAVGSAPPCLPRPRPTRGKSPIALRVLSRRLGIESRDGVVRGEGSVAAGADQPSTLCATIFAHP